MKKILMFTAVLMVLCAGLAQAGDKKEYKGWERGSTFDALYNPGEYKTYKGNVEQFFKITPVPGMAEGLGMRLKLDDGSLVDVIVAPFAYVDFLPRIFQPGERTKVKGCWVEVDGRRWFAASKVRLREMFEVKLRGTSSGIPYWDMTPEELGKAETY